jgi:hypothetical protein
VEINRDNATMYEKWQFTSRNFWQQYGSCKGLSSIERERMLTLEGNDKLFLSVLVFVFVFVFVLFCFVVDVDVLFHHTLFSSA